MWILAFFSNDEEPALGLAPIVNVRDVSDGFLVVSGSLMLEKGDGCYAYDFTAYDSTKDYLMLCDATTSSGVDSRYTYGSTGEYNDQLNVIKSTVDNVDVRTLLIRKIQTNKLELADGDSGNWILYEDDGTTPLLTFDVTDKEGSLIIQQTGVPSKRSKGY